VSGAIHSVQSSLSKRIGGLRSRLGPEYNPLVVNPEEMDVSPEFISATPPRAPPGHPGNYHPLGGGNGSSTFSHTGIPESGFSPGGWLAAPPTPSPVSRSQATGGAPV
ncbi:hypothetical protein Vretimale_18437, partial [Volvox reticuliferus]